MTDKKVFINEDNKATFMCPVCGKYKTSDVSKYKDIEKAVRIKIKCPCGTAYSVLLERRQYFRKETRLSGIYLNMGRVRAKEPIEVLDVSRTGLKFKVFFQADVKVGEKVIVEFHLDDKLGSFISKDVIIRNIRDNTIGAEFVNVDQYDKIVRYLQFE